MNGRRPKPSGAVSGGGDDKSPTLRWINIPLTPEDLALLEGEQANLEQLAYAFISLGVLGLGLSIKYDSSRKSYNVSIYGPDLANDMQPCGVSGTSPDLRDALLVSLYRFNTCLQGSFTGQSTKDSVVQPKRFG